MPSIALINPSSPFLTDDTVMPPLGIMYISSYLKEHGYDAKIIDLAVNPELDIENFDIYAITATTPQYPDAVIITNMLRKKNPYSLFVIGGAHATSFKEKCYNTFDCVIIGEGEESILSIIKFLHKNSRISRLIKSGQISDIDKIPFPNRTFLGFDKYHYSINGVPATTMITSRGCPYDCYFCCNTWGNRVRLRSAKNILDEATQLKDMGFKAIMFYDDTFTINRNRVIEIGKGLKELGIIWRCFIHASTVDYELLKAMYDFGCVEVGMGVESGNKDILKTVNKKIDLDKVISICKWCHLIGLRIKTFLVVGLPGESKETINDTINFLDKARPDCYDITIYTPFPSTFIWNNSEKFDIQFDKSTLDYSKMFYKGKARKYSCQVSTSKLTAKEIEIARDYIENQKGEKTK